jgi:hypothetical protein
MKKNKFLLFGLLILIAAGILWAYQSGYILKDSQQYAENMPGAGDIPPAGNPEETAGGNNPPAENATSGSPDQDIKRDSGRYTGRIDNNFIEIRISGVPEEISARSFMLSEEMKADFDKYGLQENDVVGFSYKTNEHGQNILTELKKI